MNNKLGLTSGFFKNPTKESWESAVAAGITDIELGLSHDFDTEAILVQAEKKYDLLSSSGLVISSIHLPFGNPWDISMLDNLGREAAIEKYKVLVDWAAEKGIGIAVLHASYEPIDDEERQQRLETATESVKILSDYAREKGVSLAVENLPRTCLGNCSDDMLTLTGNGRNAGICFDANHLLIESHKDFLEKVGPYIITTHFSDYDGIDEKHWLVGEGCVDWAEVVELLRQQGYQGRFLFELNELADPNTEEAFTPKDLVSRFKEVSKLHSLY
ncbi:MAG: sugar phosphate isomerase/epimerase [Clostridiales bacterium]|jgi:sugar phosphate isomerase/epimerase|nr:sugar phosphate isomerase/epimerase [Clostridiales bacterium]